MAIKAHLYPSFVIHWNWQVQNVALMAIFCLMFCLLIFMLLYMYQKSRHEKKHSKWRMISDMLINKAIFYEDRDEIEDQILASMMDAAKKLTDNQHFRKFMANELISAKKNISGPAADSLRQLYLELGLEKYAANNLTSRRWYVKAKAIQELTIMNVNEFTDQLYTYTNDKNDHVRMEAQSALVQFNGFEGLSFLDTITYPISNWQQIKLLQLLSQLPPSNIDIAKWFQSENSSVVVFALKLARNYHRFELHDAIASCLDNEEPQVRLEAIHCLNEIYTDETSDHFIARFLREDIKHQLAMTKVMQTVGTEKDVMFLMDLLAHENDELKLYAARALVNVSQDGLGSLEEYSKKSDKAIHEIVRHIKGETAA